MKEKPQVAPDLNDVNAILNYGAQAQSRVAEFSDLALENLKAKDLGEISGKIGELITQLKTFPDNSEKPGLKTLLRRPAAVAEGWKSRYQKACGNVDKIALSLQQHRDVLMKDVEMLELLYAKHREQCAELSAYLEEGRAALEEYRANTLQPRTAQAEKDGDPLSVQAAKDAKDRCDRFEKKLHDLELTRAVSLQMAPQIRLLQNNDTVMAEKIQSSVVNTIPLWKSQMVLTLGMENTRTAVTMQEKVSQITDELLRRNAAALKDTSLQIARESERSVIDVETLKETNRLLIETLDEMLRIRAEGIRNREEAQKELRGLEREIRQKLLTT